MWAAGIHSRAPASACPAPSRTYDRCTVLIPLASLPAQPRYCLLTPAVRVPALTCPVSSIAPTARPRRRPVLRAASSSPATANLRTTPIAAQVSQTARLSSRCVRSRAVPSTLGDRPPVPSAQVAHHRGGVLARLQPRLRPREAGSKQFQQLGAFPAPQRGAYPAGSSRLRFWCPHKRMIDRRLPSQNASGAAS
jgi:hypothetical protein